MGDQASINGRDRGTAFPRLHQEELSEAEAARNPNKGLVGRRSAAAEPRHRSQLDARSESAIYMHAGGVFLAPTLCRRSSGAGILHPAGEAGHVIIVSNDGIPQEFDAIRKGEADADRVPAGGPLRQIRHHVPTKRRAIARPDIQGRPDRPRQHDRRSRACWRSRGSARRPRWSPKRMSTTSRSGAITFKAPKLGDPCPKLSTPGGQRRSQSAPAVFRSSRRSAYPSLAARTVALERCRTSASCRGSRTRWSDGTEPASRRWSGS